MYHWSIKQFSEICKCRFFITEILTSLLVNHPKKKKKQNWIFTFQDLYHYQSQKIFLFHYKKKWKTLKT